MDPNRGPSAYQPNVLPLGQTGSWQRLYVGPWAVPPRRWSCRDDPLSASVWARDVRFQTQQSPLIDGLGPARPGPAPPSQ